MFRTTISLPDDVAEHVKKICKATGAKFSTVISRLIQKEMKK